MRLVLEDGEEDTGPPDSNSIHFTRQPFASTVGAVPMLCGFQRSFGYRFVQVLHAARIICAFRRDRLDDWHFDLPQIS